MTTLHEFVKDVTVWTMGFNQDGEPEAFVSKPQPTACGVCDTAHYLFVVHSSEALCLACSGRLR